MADIVQHPDFVRITNDRIAARAELLRFASRVPMVCECNDPSCDALVLVSLHSYRALRHGGNPILADRHTV